MKIRGVTGTLGVGGTFFFNVSMPDGRDLGSRFMYLSPMPTTSTKNSVGIRNLGTAKSVKWSNPGDPTPLWFYEYQGKFENAGVDAVSFTMELGGLSIEGVCAYRP